MLLSDRDLLVEIDGGSLSLDPFDASLIQPSSIDVRLDRYFRVFNNSKYTHIDPKIQQDELTTLVEVDGDDRSFLAAAFGDSSVPLAQERFWGLPA